MVFPRGVSNDIHVLFGFASSSKKMVVSFNNNRFLV